MTVFHVFAGHIESMPIKKTRFASVAQEDILSLLENKDSTKAKPTTRVPLNVLTEYLRENNKPTNFEDMSKKDLAQILGQFYVEQEQRMAIHIQNLQ